MERSVEMLKCSNVNQIIVNTDCQIAPESNSRIKLMIVSLKSANIRDLFGIIIDFTQWFDAGAFWQSVLTIVQSWT